MKRELDISAATDAFIKAGLLNENERGCLDPGNLNRFRGYYETSLMEIETHETERRNRRISAVLSVVAFVVSLVALAVNIIVLLC